MEVPSNVCWVPADGAKKRRPPLKTLRLALSHPLLPPRSATEMLDKDNKFFCDHCNCLQEAQKRLLIKQLPQCLILHLKRFKYVESQGK